MTDIAENKIILLLDQLEAMKKSEIDQYYSFDYPAIPEIDDNGCKCDSSYTSSILSPISPSQDDPLSMILSPEIEDNDTKCSTPNYPSPATILDIDELQCNIKLPIYYSLKEMKKEISQQIFPIRADMVNWGFHVVDNYHIDREAVFLSFSYADRYVILLDSMISSDEYTLLCMTCLYIAMKVIIHSKKKIFLSWFVDMSRGAFTSDEFVTMEMKILDTLHWKLHPPTAMSFLRLYMDSFSTSNEEYYFNQCRTFAECSIHDNFLSSIRPSIIALASIHIVFQNEILSCVDKLSFLENDLKMFHSEVMDVKDYLLSICD